MHLIISNKFVTNHQVTKPTKNPFKFGDPVAGDYYFPRPELSQTVIQFLDNRVHVVLIGPRRFGKTSFVLETLRQLEAREKTCIFLDVFNVTSHRDFLLQLLRALRAKVRWSKRLKKWVESLPGLRPKLTWETDPRTGDITFSLAPEALERDVKDLIQDAIIALGQVGDEVIVAIDEFQTIAELEDGGWLEATLRTLMQQLKNTAFLFTGSRRSVITDMLNNVSRPFYRSCQPIEFPALEDTFSDWIVTRFKSVGVACSKEVAIKLRKLVQDTPNYVQMACFHLVAGGVDKVDEHKIQEVLRTIVKQNAYSYQTLLNSLRPLQQRALRLAAVESEGIFSKGLLGKYEIPSAPALASSVKSLRQKQILDEGISKGKVIFDDPLFAIWLRTQFTD